MKREGTLLMNLGHKSTLTIITNLLNSYEIWYNCEDHANVEIKLNNGNNVCFS